MEKREPSYSAGGDANRGSDYEEQYGGSSKSQNRANVRAHNPTPGIHPEKTITQKHTSTPVFLAALFTIART